jgi:hypothetical protein
MAKMLPMYSFHKKTGFSSITTVKVAGKIRKPWNSTEHFAGSSNPFR